MNFARKNHTKKSVKDLHKMPNSKPKRIRHKEVIAVDENENSFEIKINTIGIAFAIAVWFIPILDPIIKTTLCIGYLACSISIREEM